jgi:hypothetical protein
MARPDVDAFIPPDSVYECDERIAALTADLTHILAQMSDPDRRAQMEWGEYRKWRSQATHAQAHKVLELKLLKAWKVRRINDEHAANRAAREAAGKTPPKETPEEKAERLARHEAHEKARAERLNSALARVGDEADLILRLYVALGRIYRKTKLEVSEMDQETFDRANAYLVKHEVFER